MTTLTSMSDGPLLPLLAAVESGSGLLPNDSNSSRLELFAHRFGLTHDSSYLCTACRDSCEKSLPKPETRNRLRWHLLPRSSSSSSAARAARDRYRRRRKAPLRIIKAGAHVACGIQRHVAALRRRTVNARRTVPAWQLPLLWSDDRFLRYTAARGRATLPTCAAVRCGTDPIAVEGRASSVRHAWPTIHLRASGSRRTGCEATSGTPTSIFPRSSQIIELALLRPQRSAMLYEARSVAGASRSKRPRTCRSPRATPHDPSAWALVSAKTVLHALCAAIEGAAPGSSPLLTSEPRAEEVVRLLSNVLKHALRKAHSCSSARTCTCVEQFATGGGGGPGGAVGQSAERRSRKTAAVAPQVGECSAAGWVRAAGSSAPRMASEGESPVFFVFFVLASLSLSLRSGDAASHPELPTPGRSLSAMTGAAVPRGCPPLRSCILRGRSTAIVCCMHAVC